MRKAQKHEKKINKRETLYPESKVSHTFWRINSCAITLEETVYEILISRQTSFDIVILTTT